MQKHKPVSEDVYDELKLLCATGESCVLQFRGDNGGVVRTETKIKDVFEDEDGQFLTGENGLVLQLHRLVAINGKPLEPWC